MEDMQNFYDVVVIGGGPAGLTAALYLARAMYRVVVVEAESFGGQITITSEVVNYPGVAKTSGKALTETMRKQAESFGAEFILAKVEKLDMDGDVKTVYTSRGELKCFGVLLATGAHPRQVGFAGESDFRGRGVAYCATCDGEFFTGKQVFVVGGGFAAAEESVFLTRYAKHVTILIRGDDFKCAKSTADAARENEKITVLTNTSVVEVTGGDFLTQIRYKNSKTGEETVYTADPGDTFGVFVFAGYQPATELAKGIAEIDDQGYIITDRSQATTCPGLYAAGDVCVKPLRQVVTAVGDGALAATELERYAKGMQEKTGIKPEMPKPAAVKEEEAEPSAAQAAPSDGALFDADMVAQLNTVFARMANPLILKVYKDSRPISNELEQYMTELASLTGKLSVEFADGLDEAELPCVKVCRADGSETGLAFHGVPGGHEFTSFVMGLYNAAGPGQPLDERSKERIAAIEHPVKITMIVSLACTMCPELVMAAQRIAAESPYVTAEAYDVNHFGDLKEKYNVMSVPCMILNDDTVTFGKKNVEQILDLIS